MPSIHYFQNGEGGDSRPFRFKSVLFGAIFGVAVAFLLLALCAYLMLLCAMPADKAGIISKVVLFFGAFAAGIFAGRGNKSGGWLIGLLTGLLYVLILLSVGILESKVNILSFSAIPVIITCCIVGLIGGIFGINLKKNSKKTKRR